MLFFSNEKDYKTVASALRRELKTLGLTAASHNQILEAVAKSMGHKSYAALLAAQPSATAPVKAETPSIKPVKMYGFDWEPRFLAELDKYKGYRLLNGDGSLDLVDDGALVEGIGLGNIHGTCDEIPDCTATIEGVSREDGRLDPAYSGGTDVNWDGQHTQKDTRGVELYVDANFESVPADTLFIIPKDLEYADSEERVNLLNEEVVQEYEFRVRPVLVDACKRWLVDTKLVAQALKELIYDEDWGGFGDGFEDYADAIGAPGKKGVSAIGQAQWVAGFQLHVGEFKALREELLKLA